MNLNKRYNLGLLVLFHLLLVSIIEWGFFKFIIIPTIQKHMEELDHYLPHLDEKTLNDFGITHNQTIVDAMYSAAQTFTNQNDTLSDFFTLLSNIQHNTISPQIKKIFNSSQLKEKIDSRNSQFKTNVKIFLIFIAILTVIIGWYFVYGNHKNIHADWGELLIGNILPVSLILAFELYFVENIVTKYRVMGEYGFLYECLKELYPIDN